jgi:hypothetical protein
LKGPPFMAALFLCHSESFASLEDILREESNSIACENFNFFPRKNHTKKLFSALLGQFSDFSENLFLRIVPVFMILWLRG